MLTRPRSARMMMLRAALAGLRQGDDDLVDVIAAHDIVQIIERTQHRRTQYGGGHPLFTVTVAVAATSM